MKAGRCAKWAHLSIIRIVDVYMLGLASCRMSIGVSGDKAKFKKPDYYYPF